MLSLLKWIGATGFIPFLLISIAAVAILAVVWPRWRRLAAWSIGGVLAVYLVLALPCVAMVIEGALPPVPALDASRPARLDILIVFDGDNRRGRVREAVRLYETAAPASVYSLGAEPWMEVELPKAGIPRDRLTHDGTPATTRDQTAWVERFLSNHPGVWVGVIASRLQMPRVAALMRDVAGRIMFAPSSPDREPPTTGFRRFVPTYAALRISRDALYEHAALRYYRWKGWTE